jgi:sulfoxide reductase catalytic subunit YedY
MSPAVAARFPWYLRIFGGRQAARSLHFLALVAITLFAVGHIALVAIEGFPRNMAWIIHGEDRMERVAVGVEFAGLVAVGVLHVLATKFSLRHPERVQQILGRITTPVHRFLFHHVTSRQQYSLADVGFFRVNGRPPEGAEYADLARSDFREWRLKVGGLVTGPLEMSLVELRAMPARTQIILHHCIQGWSGIAAWTGVALADVLRRSASSTTIARRAGDRGAREGTCNSTAWKRESEMAA